MNKHSAAKILACCIMLMILGYTSQVRAEPESAEQNMLDVIGKKDPFKMVTPIIEAKKNILQKMSMAGSKTNAGMVPEEKPDLYVETIMLKFLRATNIQSVATNLLSVNGAVAVDSETNSLVISDEEENLRRIINEIRKADQTPKQILIEVVLLDVQLNDDTEIGVDWNNYNFGRSDTTQTYIQKVMSNLVANGALAGSFAFVQGDLDINIRALQATRDVEILASPRVLVVSGQTALIKTTEEIPYTELTQSTGGSSDNSITSTKFKEAGVALTVTATLTDEQKILIAIIADQSINAGTDSSVGSSVPVVERRNSQTTLLMDDGQVLVMGGLRQKETTLTQSKVPLLGDLPFVGFIFSNDKKEISNSELLVFISPHIYPDGPLSDEQMERFNEIRNAPMLRLPNDRPEFKAISEVMPSYLEDRKNR
ncbi:MAG: type II secretion system protein GspD [Planctomycetota bacterium]|jgi:type II secretory pathway component GspD/PulD (secretin)